MFDISWSELLILGIVTLVFVGPKELPVFLRTIGRYVATAKKHAGEFRAQFDEAMREAEFEQIRRDVMSMKTDVETSVRDAERTVQGELDAARQSVDAVAQTADPSGDRGMSGEPGSASAGRSLDEAAALVTDPPASTPHAPPAATSAASAPVETGAVAAAEAAVPARPGR